MHKSIRQGGPGGTARLLTSAVKLTTRQCRVCRNDQVRKTVNDMLASGASYALILRALGEDNAALGEKDRVTIDSIRNHCQRHFPVQHVAHATYREILERRARRPASTSSTGRHGDHADCVLRDRNGQKL